MYDQAHRLRQLVRTIRTLPERNTNLAVIGIGGVRGQIGTTTLAQALSEECRGQGHEVLLLSGGYQSSQVSPVPCPSACSTGCSSFRPQSPHPQSQSAEAQTALRLVPWRPKESALLTGRCGEHAIRLCIVDLGLIADVSREGRSVDHIAIVTTPKPADILATYLAIKRLAGSITARQISVLINNATQIALGEEMARRLRAACERFLQMPPNQIVVLPLFSALTDIDAEAIRSLLVNFSPPTKDAGNDEEGETNPLVASMVQQLWWSTVRQAANSIIASLVQNVPGPAANVSELALPNSREKT